ncbi:excisionase family protein [Cronobacter sakazakii]|uniref:excisionase family protein n=1 Tax=Enterobacteriaceae TaxID=543 RepID=UPI0008FF343F|nr:MULTISPECIES: excisionase family protein [Enterobacteriaceae]ELY2562263.1 excisionase family protein [Cronobacter sakazakii]ELY2721426.1 excisionase family protein [Cronobacter sakazakii]ELY2773316.1 excisionase family protein [Cronobacter sakazakii]ELY4087383.1 excisionase family protein [Cronobacter sakazakii]ELY4540669.1 excisionase family protein [Cronobacter sakazakii]
MPEVIQLTPNKWVTEEKLIAVTGLRPGTIVRARKESWLQGREYLHISPDGDPKPNSECFYNCEAINAWIERQASKQPGAVCHGKA